MNILIINYEYPPIGAGASNASYHIAKSLSELNHRVTVMTSSFKKLKGKIQEDGITVYRIWALRKSQYRSNIGEMIGFVFSSFIHIGKIIKEQEIEVALIFFTVPSGLMAPYIKKRYHIPYVISLRGGDVPGLERSISIIHKFIRPVRQKILKNAKGIVANSKGLADASQKYDPFPVKIIPNGVNINFFSPDKKEEDVIIRFLFVGRFHEQKNLFFLLEKFHFFSKGKEDVKLILVGDGPQKNELITFSQKLGLSDKIMWKPWLDKKDLVAEYRCADCFLNPSLYEGMPNAVMEAMSCELPVIASNIMGNNELVTEAYSGYLFDLHDESAFQKALMNIYINKKKRQQMGRNARDFISINYSWKSVAERYESILMNKIN